MRRYPPSTRRGVLFSGLASTLLALVACSPTLDWRLTPISGTSLTAFFPCKPDQFSRQISLAGNSERVVLVSCKAAQHTFAVTAVDMQRDERRLQGVTALKSAAQQNFGGFSQTLPPRLIPGAAQTGRADVVTAKLSATPARSLQAQMVFFSHGRWVFQATVMAETLEPDAVVFFFDNLKLNP
ncbi:MAG: hypothetical protein ACKOF9_10750 [Burkholderiales bacterium]